MQGSEGTVVFTRLRFSVNITSGSFIHYTNCCVCLNFRSPQSPVHHQVGWEAALGRPRSSVDKVGLIALLSLLVSPAHEISSSSPIPDQNGWEAKVAFLRRLISLRSIPANPVHEHKYGRRASVASTPAVETVPAMNSRQHAEHGHDFAPVRGARPMN
jgi:hypothetical protein